MAIDTFEDMIAWQKAKVLVVGIYAGFKEVKDRAFKDQIQRAAVSVMNNVAEGFERKSNKEFVYFLYVAKGSCGEVRSMLSLAEELEYVSNQNAQILKMQATEVSKILSGFIKTL